MARQARNGPCPYGSGRKYKRCCLGEEERLARDARLETDVGRAIADWSAAAYADELADAFEEFHPESRRVDDGVFAQFLTWFNSDRELSDGRTPVERYAARPDVDPAEREVAERIAAARLGLHRVRSVAPGQSIELENVLTGTSIRVASQSVSRELVRWDVVLCRVMPGEPLPSLWGPVLTYEPGEEPELLAELERLADEHGQVRRHRGPGGGGFFSGISTVGADDDRDEPDVKVAKLTNGRCGKLADSLPVLISRTGARPGEVVGDVTVCVANSGDAAALLSLRVFELVDVDRACTGAEPTRDSSCGGGKRGELSPTLLQQVGLDACPSVPPCKRALSSSSIGCGASKSCACGYASGTSHPTRTPASRASPTAPHGVTPSLSLHGLEGSERLVG